MGEKDLTRVLSVLQDRKKDAEERRRVLFEMMRLIGENDFTGLGRYFTEDVRFSVAGYPPIDGEWEGQEAVLGSIANNFSLVALQRPEITGMVEQDDVIVMKFIETGQLGHRNQAYRARGVFWFEFSGSLVRSIEQVVCLQLQAEAT
jgi:ketosteroid isomerase-like protein